MGASEVRESLYVCVHVPELAAQACMRLRPELERMAVAVVAGEVPLEQVCSLNAQASALGVEKGMMRAELDGFAGLYVLRRSEVEESVARGVLLEAAWGFTPRVEVQTCSADAFVMVLDMTGTTRMFGPASQVVASMKRLMNALHFHARFAASTNLHAAVCMARSARTSIALLPPGKEKEFLRKLPLDALRLSSQQADTLSLWGLHTLGELADVPEVELVVRLGQEGKRLRLLARGEYPHLMVPEEPVFALEEFIAFDTPVELLDSLLFVLGPMLDQLIARAQNRAFALASVTVTLGLDGGGTHERTIKPALPVIQREVLLKLLHLDLQAHPASAGVLSIFVRAEPGDCSKVQLGLFSPQLPEPMRLEVTLARIGALLGEGRVGRARLSDSHRSDSFVMERFVLPTGGSKGNAHSRNTAALRRCRPPVPLHVQHEGQHLAGIFFQGKRYAVQEAYGPWRRSGEWWSASVWSREEWDVRACAGSEDLLLCVLTYDLLRRQWEMEGLYD
jgi:protein ImuB